jgi:hypothetical protein
VFLCQSGSLNRCELWLYRGWGTTRANDYCQHCTSSTMIAIVGGPVDSTSALLRHSFEQASDQSHPSSGRNWRSASGADARARLADDPSHHVRTECNRATPSGTCCCYSACVLQ